MVCIIVGVDKEVIHINDEPSFGDHVPEGIQHKSLESGGRIGHPKEHDGWFVESAVSNEGGFPLVAFLNANIIVPPSDIKLSKDFGVLEFVNEVRDKR